MAAGKVKVRVVEGWAVYADGAQRSGGETVEVDRDQAVRWCAAGWAVEAATSTRRPATGTTRRPARPKAG